MSARGALGFMGLPVEPREVDAFRRLLRGCQADAVAAVLGEPQGRLWFHVDFAPHCAWSYEEGRLQVLFDAGGVVVGLYRRTYPLNET